MSTKILPTADVDERATIGDGTSIWHLAQIREDASIGRNCIIGRGAYVGTGVHIGDNCKIQNYALVYEPAELGTGVFIGPAVVLTNDVYPRSISPDGALKRADDWDAAGVRVEDGAAIGARAVILGGVQIGSWAVIGAGAVITKDVASHALVVGVPGRQVGWVGYAGLPLDEQDDGSWVCPHDGTRYVEDNGQLTEAS